MDTKYFSFFFFNDTATTEIYTLSLHDALPILVEFVENEKKKFENSKLSHEEILKNAYDKYVSDEIEKLKKEEDGTYNIIYENTLINIEAQVDTQIAQLKLLEKNEGVKMPSRSEERRV